MKVQNYSVDNWSDLDIQSNGQTVFSYLNGDCSAITKIRAFLQKGTVEDVAARMYSQAEKLTVTEDTISTTISVNCQIWYMHVLHLRDSDGSEKYYSFCFTFYGKHCIMIESEASNKASMSSLLQSFKSFIQSLALATFIHEQGTLVKDDLRVTVRSLTETSINENSNADALFFISNTDYCVFYLEDTSDISVVEQAETIIADMCKEECKVTRIVGDDDATTNTVRYSISSKDSVNYFTFYRKSIGDNKQLSAIRYAANLELADITLLFGIEVI